MESLFALRVRGKSPYTPPLFPPGLRNKRSGNIPRPDFSLLRPEKSVPSHELKMQSRACIFALRAVLVGARNLQLPLTRTMFCLAFGLRQKCWALQACPMSAQNLARVILFFPRPLSRITLTSPPGPPCPSTPDLTTSTDLKPLSKAPARPSESLRSMADGAADPTSPGPVTSQTTYSRGHEAVRRARTAREIIE